MSSEINEIVHKLVATSITVADSEVITDTDKVPKSKSTSDLEPISDEVIKLVGMILNQDFSSDPELFQTYYAKLNTTIECLPKERQEYAQILKYVENGHGPTHKFKVKVRNIFIVHRKGEFRKFQPNKKLGNRKLLWHGTKLSNVQSILENGLLPQTPTNVSTNGKMFGNGVYFADVVTKAAQYSGSNQHLSCGILVLAEVALGKHYYRTKSEQVDKLPEGKNSVKGLGRYKPTINETVKTQFYARIPLGTLEHHSDLKTVLNYSEYIVYDNSQILIQYLVLVDFTY